MLTVGLVTVIQHGEGALNGSTVVQGTGRGTVLWRLLVLCDSGATALHCGNGISKRVCSESFAEQGQPWWATARQGKQGRVMAAGSDSHGGRRVLLEMGD